MTDQGAGGGASEVERLKLASDYLRGTIRAGLADPLTGTVSEGDGQLLKFHGTYSQDDRDLRAERRRQRLEPAYQFMVRVRSPGGVLTPAQWLDLDRIARTYADGTIRLTTRQTVQLHGVLKGDLQRAIAEINETLLTTLGACGDVNRNVMSASNPFRSGVHAEAYALAARLSEHLLPRTSAYHEIWLGGDQVAGGHSDAEPLYGKAYLPRKFKIAIAVPPVNDVDVFAHDIGLIAVVEAGGLAGLNVSVGGGMGTTYGDPATYPRRGSVIGRCAPAEASQVCEAIVAIQRDFGDRSERKHARLKYTIDDRGLGWFVAELERRLGFALKPSAPYRFERSGDRLGWAHGEDARHHLTWFVPGGRVCDAEARQLSAMRAIAGLPGLRFVLTPNQNVIVANASDAQVAEIDAILARHGGVSGGPSPLRRSAMACVALPTCGLAMAEAERYLPAFMAKLQGMVDSLGLSEEEITVRVSGCPNGCSRPYLAEIGLTGKAPGRYNLHLGGGFAGERLNRMYRENIGEAEILATLAPLLGRYASARRPGERFGDFLVREDVVKPVADRTSPDA